MTASSREVLLVECLQLQEDSTYNAETHFTMAKDFSRQAYWLRLVPMVITLALSIWIFQGTAPNWAPAATVFSSLFTLMNMLSEPEKKASAHTLAGQSFTALKHEARSLKEAFESFYTDDALMQEVRSIRQRYAMLVQLSPITSDKAFMKAREKIKAGIHEPDHQKLQ